MPIVISSAAENIIIQSQHQTPVASPAASPHSTSPIKSPSTSPSRQQSFEQETSKRRADHRPHDTENRVEDILINANIR